MLVKYLKCLMIVLVSCLLTTACGNTTEEQSSMDVLSTESTVAQLQDVYKADGTMDYDKLNDYLGIDSEEVDTKVAEADEVPENVIQIAALAQDYMDIYENIVNYNKVQDEYKVEIKKYEKRDDMILDLIRGEGCDIFVLEPSYMKILGNKNALEDLTSYFDESEIVNKEDLFSCVLDAGTVNEKIVGIMSCFSVQATLVKKGYVDDGGWTLDEYFALMDSSDVPICTAVSTGEHAGVNWFYTDLAKFPELYVDWNLRTCDFENETFIYTIEKLKEYIRTVSSGEEAEMGYAFGERAESLYNNKIQTMNVQIQHGRYFSDYKEIRDTFLEAYDLVGCPNISGEPEYVMAYGELVYCINANSKKKEEAWKFLEYILSYEYQHIMMEMNASYSVRMDVVEGLMQEEIEADPETADYSYRNFYTGERVRTRGVFTEADKEKLMYILEHAITPTMFWSGNDFEDIFLEEIEAFFVGDKTARETAQILQNRVSLFLME